jgi:hypothetical protein
MDAEGIWAIVSIVAQQGDPNDLLAQLHEHVTQFAGRSVDLGVGWLRQALQNIQVLTCM